MAQILHLSTTAPEEQVIDDLLVDSDLRVKHASSARQCLEWLELWNFDGMLVKADFPLEELSPLTDQLWSKNQAAPFWVYDFEADSIGDSSRIRLLGGSCLSGDDGRELLKKQLSEIASRSSSPLDFRVMVVEDLDSPRDIICFFLEKFGYTAEGFSSANDALSRLSEHASDYDCIVTDYRMPRVNGEQFIRSVRARKELANMPVIVLTAYGTVDSLIACLKAGASGFLLKPPKKADLRREMGRAIRIQAGQLSARLSSSQDAESLRELLVDKGFV